MNINIPVSIGEALDKLSILQLKLELINDSRKIEVKREYDILQESLKMYILNSEEFYVLLCKVNKLIWHQMDKLRDGKLLEAEYLNLCKECILYNDIRFRIKNKINLENNSYLKEQKSYKTNSVIVYINCNIPDSNIKGPFKYLTLWYDEILVCTNKRENKFNKYIKLIDENELEKYIKDNESVVKNKYYINDIISESELYKVFEASEEMILLL